MSAITSESIAISIGGTQQIEADLHVPERLPHLLSVGRAFIARRADAA